MANLQVACPFLFNVVIKKNETINKVLLAIHTSIISSIFYAAQDNSFSVAQGKQKAPWGPGQIQPRTS